MTTQIDDTITYLGNEFAIAGIEQGSLFDPHDHNIKPTIISSACWHGFFCRYEIAGDILRLDRLWVGLEASDREAAFADAGPLFQGRLPSYDQDERCFRYDQLALAIKYSGGLLLGSGFIWELNAHTGFHPAWAYQQVYELLFEQGRLITAEDLSNTMSEIRMRRSQVRTQTSDSARPISDAEREAGFREWIERCFDRSYRR